MSVSTCLKHRAGTTDIIILPQVKDGDIFLLFQQDGYYPTKTSSTKLYPTSIILKFAAPGVNRVTLQVLLFNIYPVIMFMVMLMPLGWGVWCRHHSVQGKLTLISPGR